MTDPDEDPLVPYQDSDAGPASERGEWRWLIITVVVLLFVCGGLAVAVNSWLGDTAAEVRESVAAHLP
ncbi:MAG: hypothetical protein SYR96_26515 [Actinomycetota bacterium]|nr:hypothetical protein [Actinomycetota bacterium]